MIHSLKDFPAYGITKTGDVYSRHKQGSNLLTTVWTKRKLTLNSVGYLVVGMRDTNNIRCVKTVHRLVMETFIPNLNNLPQVNHIDGNKQNNNLSNLEWCNASDNAKHAFATGLKSADNLCITINKLDKQGNFIKQYLSTADAERETKISNSSICQVCNGYRKTAGGFKWEYA